MKYLAIKQLRSIQYRCVFQALDWLSLRRQMTFILDYVLTDEGYEVWNCTLRFLLGSDMQENNLFKQKKLHRSWWMDNSALFPQALGPN